MPVCHPHPCILVHVHGMARACIPFPPARTPPCSHPWPGMDNTWSAIFHIAKTTTGPPTPEESSEEGRDFLAACFQLDPALRPSAAQVRASAAQVRASAAQVCASAAQVRASAAYVFASAAQVGGSVVQVFSSAPQVGASAAQVGASAAQVGASAA
ncbi:unnamed protein product [Closterium sp. NIES-53]